jgi:small subunit ribosomal protein S4
MARYLGSKAKISRKFGEPVLGATKNLERKPHAPGQHGTSRKRKQLSEFGVQLKEKQKAKYTYGLLERQFAKTYQEAARKKGVTGENLLKLLEARLDNTVYRLGIAPTRRAARQLVGHKHVTVNGNIVNVPSYSLRPGDKIGLKDKSRASQNIGGNVGAGGSRFAWLEWNGEKLEGTFLAMPERDQITENIREQLIVELYSK